MTLNHVIADKLSFVRQSPSAQFSGLLLNQGVTAMGATIHPYVTNSQPLGVRPWVGKRPHLLARIAATLRVWRQRSRERRALAELNERELADFGATSADVYRELSAPIWRSLPPL
jgi:uncharacterized protein YjiS (DUF1127 family)